METYQDDIYGGNHYFVSFIDDFSRPYKVYTMRHKGKVLKFFVEWKRNKEKNTRRKIKVLCSEDRSKYSVQTMVESTLAILSYNYDTMRA